MNLTHQGTTIFATWFTYDANRNPLVAVGDSTADRAEHVRRDALPHRRAGVQRRAVRSDPVTRTAVGAATFKFTNGNSGSFTYNVDFGDGVNKATQSKAITRQVFRAPGTVCQ